MCTVIRSLVTNTAISPPGTGTIAPAPAAPPRDPDYERLLAALGHDALGIDQLAARTGLAVAALSSMLLMLELEGEVVAAGGGAYARRVG